MDFYVDEKIDDELFIKKKNSLIKKQKQLEFDLNNFDEINYLSTIRTEAFLELVNNAYLSYKWGKPEEKRELVKYTTSNFLVTGKSLLIKLNLPFEMVQNRQSIPAGRASRLAPRTQVTKMFKWFLNYFENPEGFPLPKDFGNKIEFNPKNLPNMEIPQ